MGKKYTTFDPAVARKEWAGAITENTGVTDSSKLQFISEMCAIKENIDRKKAESSLIGESYSSQTPSDIAGMGATTFPSDPGTGVGAMQAPYFQDGYKRGSGDVPNLQLSLAMNTAAYTIGLELLPFINMEGPSTMHAYLDAVYGGGTLKDAGNAPIYLQIGGDITKGWRTTGNYTKGDVLYLGTDDGAGALVASEALKVTYMQKHRFAKAIIVKFEDFGDIADTTWAFTANDTYDVDSVLEAVVANGAIFKENTADVVGTVSNPLGVDKATATFVSATDMFTLGFANSDGISETPMTREQAELGTSNTVNLRMFTTAVEAKASHVIASVGRIQNDDLGYYGINASAELYREGQNQLTQTINRNIINDFFRLGVTSAANLKSSQGVDLNTFIAPAGTASKDLANFNISEFIDITGVDRSAEFTGVVNAENNSAAETVHTRQRRIRSRILAASYIISSIGRKGKGDVAIVNNQIAAALSDMPEGLTAAPDNSIIAQNQANLYFIGVVAGVRVYCDPMMDWEDTRIAVGRKGDANTPGMKFFAYDLANSIELIPEGTEGLKISILSRYAIVHAGFYPETQYLTFGLDNGFGEWI